MVRQKKKNLKKESKKIKSVNEELAKINYKKENLQFSALLSSTSVPVSALSGNNSPVTKQNHQSNMASTEPVPSPSVSSDQTEENVTTTDSITTVPATDPSTDASSHALLHIVTSDADVTIPTEKNEPQSKCKIPFSVSQLHHEVPKLTDDNMHRREEIGFRTTVNKDFKAFPVIVRANGREKKCLAVENNVEFTDDIQLSPALIEELGMTDKPYKNSREDWIKVSVSETMVTISSFDDKQTIRVGNEFDKERFCCPPSTRSYYQSVAERWWPHLFGPGQLSREEEMVHVQLTPNMAKAFECSALTTAEFHSSPTCNVCANYPFPSEHRLSYFVVPPCRAGKTSSPETDYYWLMDKQTYNVTIFCEDREPKLSRAYGRRMEKRDNFIKSEQYLDIARGFGTSIKQQQNKSWEDLFCCCLKPKTYGK